MAAGVPTTVTLDDDTRRDLSFIMKHCPTPRSASAAFRGIVSKYKKLLEQQIEAEREERRLWLTDEQPARGERLDLQF